MDYVYDVSILVLSYRPALQKLLTSLKAAIQQVGVRFEVIVSDDGSETDYFHEIEAFFEKNHFKDYRLIKNSVNVGTVRNIYGAVLQSSGKYIYLNSPGDYLFDPKAMSDFFRFAESRKADICFGDYISYTTADDGGVRFDTRAYHPSNVEVFSRGIRNYRTDFFIGWGILGASYFRSREFALESLDFAARYSKFTEDGTTTAYALLKNIPVYYYPRKIVWYENGTGISANGFSRVKQDFLNTYRALLKRYPRSRILKAGLFFHENEDNPRCLYKLAVRFPLISARKRMLGRLPKRTVSLSDREKLDFSRLCGQ